MAPTIIHNVKTFEEIWAEDKERLRQSPYEVSIDWTHETPSQEDGEAVLKKRGELIKDAQAFSITQKVLDDLLEESRSVVEQLWDLRLDEVPKVEVHNLSALHARCGELDKITAQALGKTPSPFTKYIWCLFPYPGILLLPTHSPCRTKEGTFEEYAISKEHLGSLMVSGLTRALCRQLRGEWRENFATTLNKHGPVYGTQAVDLIAVIDLITHERLLEKNPERTLYAVAEKVERCWTRLPTMLEYRGLDALLRQKGLADTITRTLFFLPNKAAKNDEEVCTTLVAAEAVSFAMIYQSIRNLPPPDPRYN